MRQRVLTRLERLEKQQKRGPGGDEYNLMERIEYLMAVYEREGIPDDDPFAEVYEQLARREAT